MHVEKTLDAQISLIGILCVDNHLGGLHSSLHGSLHGCWCLRCGVACACSTRAR